MTLPKTLATVMTAAAAFSLLPAMAASTDVQEKSQDVSIRGYDLTDVNDAKAVLEKIEKAADRVCTISSERATVRERILRRACAESAIGKAVAALDAPEVTALADAEDTK